MSEKVNKSQLSWKLSDYLVANEEPPPCVLSGSTEGQTMEPDDIDSWLVETIRCLTVFKQEYPYKFDEQFAFFEADLDYLVKIGKITKEQKDRAAKKENFDFE